ncbi:hypothetical protein Nepgr_023858 [Nepenthes gracilis]|uniref:Pentatricopeptide repeat-containing protein n=1 Tax=Nepenthes gracilis TaxID=150966 RepID=A0AAD3T382_NEPGR|nr:hypothetical protein Nepgr_023858 [Nepenthes gracilis]
MDLNLSYYSQLLQPCNTAGLIHRGRQLHLVFLKKGILNCTVTVGNRLLQMYAKCGTMADACRLFEEMPQRNCFSWNTLIEGYMCSGDQKSSLQIFHSMPNKNDFSWNIVISGTAKMGDLESAQRMFYQMPRRNGFAWNSMIHGYARHGYPREALRMFKDLNLNPLEVSGRDTFVLATVIGACTSLTALDCGKQIHARIIIDDVDFDSVLGSSLVNLYGKCGDLDSAEHVSSSLNESDDFSQSALITGYANIGSMNDARRIFDRITDPSVALWNSIIAGYISNNEDTEALILFNTMRENGIREDFSTFASIFSAFTSVGVLDHGKQLHAHAYKLGVSKDVIVSCALIDMYSKCRSPNDACNLFNGIEFCDTVLLNSMINVYSNCGKMQEAKRIFDTMPHRNLISWNSMVVGFSQNGWPILALDHFREMNTLEIQMDKFSLASVISACASISAFELGEQVFARATVIGLEGDRIVCSSLVDFYCKCGFIDLGRKLFERMEKFDEVSWNSMLMGYATNGQGIETLNLFSAMRNAGIHPNGITFTAILSACDHCGLIEEARKWFYLMQCHYNINPGYEHYSCMVDLFARAGCIEEAMVLIKRMPLDADATMWSSVLRGCVAHGNKTLGNEVAKLIINLDPKNSGAYVQLCSALAASGNWEGSEQVRSAMKNKNIEKNPGLSWGDT